MDTHETQTNAPVQNLGLLDRTVRLVIGGAMLAAGLFLIAGGGNVVYGVGITLFSIYPLMTTMMGWDPLYQAMHSRSCRIEGGRNACGTLPFEVDAALGHKPVPDHEYDHSLSGSHHELKRVA